MLRALATISLVMLACARDESSRLERASTQQQTLAAEPTKAPPSRAGMPPQDAEYVELALALDPEATLRILTVGRVELPLVDRPTAFAREEDLAFDGCSGDGFARTCTVHHRYGRFEAEPPAGKILETDAHRFDGVTSHHTIDATGARIGTTTVEGPLGPPPFADTELGQALVDVHRFACLRFPAEKVAVGAKWNDECRFVLGGVVVKQNVAWELSALDADPSSGQRAELTMVGELVAPHPAGERRGTIRGHLYWFVEHKAPHILRLETKLPLDPAKPPVTKTILNLQFARVLADGTLVRTDGQPLEPAARGVATPPSDR
ncbi:MAG TPA: hypothetical protein VG755_33090 [Nannocystaceae bacterium]|nr:hypothetical protein [Nannocystaceae bacterium]